MGDLAAGDPEMCGWDFASSRMQRLGQSHLAIELERARLHRKGARRRRWLRVLVDDANGDAHPRQPECEDESGRTGADDEDFRAGWRHLRPVGPACSISRSRTGLQYRPVRKDRPYSISAPAQVRAGPFRLRQGYGGPPKLEERRLSDRLSIRSARLSWDRLWSPEAPGRRKRAATRRRGSAAPR